MSAPAVVLWPTSPPPTSPRLHELGWIEFFLPDNTTYYVHPTLRATTDIDLRNSSKLDVVTSYFGRYKDGAPSGLELYLCERKSKRRDTALVEWWVDSAKRVISSKVHNVEGETQLLIEGKDDVLDMEYRYWTFIESHPAHCAVANAARLEAMDILTWSWTDQILPARTGIRTPFTQAECQELMNLLRSFEGNQTQALLHNRVIARIFLRLLEWRQSTYRPDKPLPASFARFKRNPLRTSFLQRLFRIIVGGACLGVPFLFATRMRHRMDIESGVHKTGSMFLLCAGTCLVAAVVLSASVTFLSLPGLDNIARIAGLVSVLLAAFSIASTVPAIFRYKADVERASAMLNSEGLIFISRRNVVFSLPIVFLLYAIVGFVTAVVLYSFRGAPAQQPFSDYTSWIVVGVVGACLGVLTTSVLIMTR
ncbi:hypothetical protein CYLTODRAFT_352645 [Cylindrobasidium torrendii FP15055 ss-10]|uniref:WW domain-containing protein n=1 Tax=Cylindrobasidium torrendii FP15055 ss-10 TaxID=1314674 RepID=A0A0D7BC38_9AGAR|nr:hypothetical protein CYLTODRAFT_352645 [Cylindrobasidium torrendii FP15055 ss-10]